MTSWGAGRILSSLTRAASRDPTSRRAAEGEVLAIGGGDEAHAEERGENRIHGIQALAALFEGAGNGFRIQKAIRLHQLVQHGGCLVPFVGGEAGFGAGNGGEDGLAQMRTLDAIQAAARSPSSL